MHSKWLSTLLLGWRREREAKRANEARGRAATEGEGAGRAPSAPSPPSPDDHSNHSNPRLEQVPGTMRHSTTTLSWNVQSLGSFPVSSTSAEALLTRLDRFQPSPPFQTVRLSVSLQGVRVSKADQSEELSLPLMAHSLRRVNSVVGRAERRLVAYVALEPAGETYRRQCHVFRTDAAFQVEEIESVLGKAFHASLARRQPPPAVAPSPRPQSQQYPPSSCEKRLSSAFLSRIFGKSLRAETIEEVVHKEGAPKRKRRPVSAVFSTALQRLQSTATLGSKRMSTIEVRRDETPRASPPTTTAAPLQEETPRRVPLPSPTLQYDENLSEWVFPVDAALEEQLAQLAFFCRAPRDTVLRALLSKPTGAFVLRISESRSRCLALSVHVPQSHKSSGVAHYQILRNDKGFRIKGFSKYFDSLLTLVTHHSVHQEQLPVRLVFVHWQTSDWRSSSVPMALHERTQRSQGVKSRRASKDLLDENRNARVVDESLLEAPCYLESQRHTKYIDED